MDRFWRGFIFFFVDANFTWYGLGYFRLDPEREITNSFWAVRFDPHFAWTLCQIKSSFGCDKMRINWVSAYGFIRQHLHSQIGCDRMLLFCSLEHHRCCSE